ncbi:MAG TPA: phosphoglucosamine mutase [Oscillatoriales cyanobacterium M59_W2019_021]|nr:MAG: phosphoglucosamine mutase [Cyanobacteria bacterium J055]HIK31881.1 phosphoglucosamine mutase [Oscillatoriales cyanobacterium M4454_W2019_049]HIK51448.1 phosphoglucosamine mutase [Oscillatoriales cyanobacterium M59_W2019_021]
MVLSSTEKLSGSRLGLTAASLAGDTPVESLRDVSLLWQTLSLPQSALFGTDGIRGHVGQLLSAPLAFQVGFWAGRVLGEGRPMIIGQDSRNSSPMLANAVAAGLRASGLDVWDLGLCPTPCVAYLASQLESGGGVMISASHNPPEDNGIKFFGANGAKLPAAVQKEIEAQLRGSRPQSRSSNWGDYFARPELINEYVESLQQPFFGELDLSGMKIVLDLAWGAVTQLAPRVFRAMGAQVICLHDRPDGDRINVNCGSTHLEPLRQAVLEHQADLGFAFDGDADRVLAVDDRGRAVDGDYILYLWGQALRQAGQLPENLIITTVMANLGFERAWAKIGGQMLRTAVGDQYVHAAMRETGSVLGGEQSGHVICSHYGVSGDGLLTALHLAALVHRQQTPLSEMVAQSFQTYPQVLQNVRVEDRDRRLNWHECEPLQTAIAAAEADMGDRGRVLVRASGTEPLIRVMVEAATDELVDRWTDNLVSTVRQHLV